MIQNTDKTPINYPTCYSLPLLLISFSGGRTSAFMTKWIIDNWNTIFNDLLEKVIQFGYDKNEFLLKPYPNENYKIDMYTPSVVYKEVHTFDKNHTLDFLKKDVPQTFEDYELKGIIANKYYQQYFILYTKPYVIDNRMDGLYHYILVQKVDGELKIIHTIPPRLEIIDGDIMYFNYGNFSLGPFMFV
jgi:hypothetical protein